MKKGGFFRISKKWEPRWCTFGGRIFQAFKNKDDKVPLLQIDITKAIVTGSNERNLQVLELIAQGKRSYWTSPSIEAWIRAMHTVSINSLNSKRRTDYGGAPELNRPLPHPPPSADIDSSGEAYQSLDVATEEEDRVEQHVPSSSGHGNRHAARAKVRKNRKRMSGEDSNAAPEETLSPLSPSSAPYAHPSHVTEAASTLQRDTATNPEAKVSSSASSAVLPPGLPPTAPHSSSSTSTGVPGLSLANTSSLIGPNSPAPPKSPSRSKPPNTTVTTSFLVPVIPSDSIAKPSHGRSHRRIDRPQPKKVSSVGNLKASALHDELFSTGVSHRHRTHYHLKGIIPPKKGRSVFDDTPCKEAIARYASIKKSRHSSTHVPHRPPQSPRAATPTPSNASATFSASHLELDSEFEDPYYDNDDLIIPPTTSELDIPEDPTDFPPHLKLPSIQASFQVVNSKTTSDHKSRWTTRYCTFDGIWLRSFANANDAKWSSSSSSSSATCSTFDISHTKVTPIYISRIMCLDIHDEDSGRREFWRGSEIPHWLPHLERFAGRGYDPMLGGLMVRQCHRDESQWVARYCTFNGHQFQSFRHQSDTHPIWSCHIRHLSTRSTKQASGVELMELLLDGGTESIWWTPPANLISGIVRPLPVVKRFNFTVGSAATSGGDTPTLASVLRGTAPLEVPEENRYRDTSSARDSVVGREDDEDEMRTLKTRISDWINVIREAHEISVGDSERYIADEWELDSDGEQDGQMPPPKRSAFGATTSANAMKGVLNYRLGKKAWEPRFVELVGRSLYVFKKKHDKKPEFAIKVTKCKPSLKKDSNGKHADTLEIIFDDFTHVFRGKSLSQWNEAIVSLGTIATSSHTVGAGATDGINPVSTIVTNDPTELSAAESHSESVITSNKWGAHEESETDLQDGVDSRSEDVRRDPEEQPKHPVQHHHLAFLPHRKDSDGKRIKRKSSRLDEPGSPESQSAPLPRNASGAPTAASSANPTQLTGAIYSQAVELEAAPEHVTNPVDNSVAASSILSLASNSLLNQSAADITTEESSSNSTGANKATSSPRGPFKFRTPSAALDSVKSHASEALHQPLTDCSDADDNQFAPTVENMPKPAWTGPIARYRPEQKDWVGRYIILRPGTDILVYLAKPLSIESVPPLTTIDLTHITSVLLTSVDSYPSLELTDPHGKKHVWYASDVGALVELIESSCPTLKAKKRSSKKLLSPIAASPSKRSTPKINNTSGSSPTLDIPSRPTSTEKGTKSPQKGVS